MLIACDDAEPQPSNAPKWLTEALQTMAPRYSQVLRMYYAGGMNTDDIASTLGIHRSTVVNTLKKARARLERCRLKQLTDEQGDDVEAQY